MSSNGKEQVRRLNCLTNDMDMLYHQAARKLGVSDSVLCVLYVLYEKGSGCLLADICQESGLHKQTINSALRQLEKEAVLYLAQDKGNAKRVFLTEKGQARISQTAARLYEAECRVFAQWTEEEADTYVRLMKKYICSLEAQITGMECASPSAEENPAVPSGGPIQEEL